MSSFIVVDTDILINVSHQDSDAINHLLQLEATSSVAVSAVTQMEPIIGSRNKAEQQTTEKFLTRFQTFAVIEDISNLAVELLKRYGLSHGLVMADALIAANALFYNAPLSSKNQRDFRFIANLNLLAYP